MWPRHRAILQHLCAFDWNWSKRRDCAAIDKQIVLNFLGIDTPMSSWSAAAIRRLCRTLEHCPPAADPWALRADQQRRPVLGDLCAFDTRRRPRQSSMRAISSTPIAMPI
jgi:hypothetical protein